MAAGITSCSIGNLDLRHNVSRTPGQPQARTQFFHFRLNRYNRFRVPTGGTLIYWEKLVIYMSRPYDVGKRGTGIR